MNPQPIRLQSCPKGWSRDLDKAMDPAQTIARVQKILRDLDLDILAENRRVDMGRLGIPVYMSICGADAASVMPVRKQMGKGSSPEQAQASALMELLERYSFFSFWQRLPHVVEASWSEAEKMFGENLIPLEHMLASVDDKMSAQDARLLLDAATWQFYPATLLGDEKIVWLPLDWFRMLGEFNGSAAGNAQEESLLQALGELIERHVSAIISEAKPVLASINPDSCEDPVLRRLLQAYKCNGVNIVLKDISLGMPMPTVAALAWDPATFPEKSEIVFTAGAATSPQKAAIRALTEVAQLAGDFCTASVYEASGLEKFSSLGDIDWLLQGPVINLSDLPDISSPDMRDELLAVVKALSPLPVYAARLDDPQLGIAAHWCIAPGLEFRERDKNKSIGLFVGRKLAEEAPRQAAEKGFALLEKVCGKAHYLPFFRGMLALREGEADTAHAFFREAAPLQPDPQAQALAAFYAAYALTGREKWLDAVPWLEEALKLDPNMKEAANLLGVCFYKTGDYARAESFFDHVLSLDRGSVTDLANRGICRKMQGRLAEARQDLQAALAVDPGLDFARKHLLELDRA